MRESTKILKEKAKRDYFYCQGRNNNQYSRRTPEENEQSKNDRIKYITDKWNKIKETAETPTQIKYCDMVLDAVKYIR